MPYSRTTELPKNVKENLPKHALDIYKETFNSAWETYKEPEKRCGDESREEVAHKVAWAAVKNEYEKDEDSGQWKKKKRHNL